MPIWRALLLLVDINALFTYAVFPTMNPGSMTEAFLALNATNTTGL